MSMIELMIAIAVLAIGMSGAMILISTSIASNNRNKFDTTATNLSAMMLERLAAVPVDAATSFTVYDCVNNAFAVNPAGTTTGTGAVLFTSGMNTGNIDFTQAPSPSAGYSINYVTCPNAAGTRATYNIRWNIKVLRTINPSNPASTPLTTEITVAARQIGDGDNNNAWAFAPPVTLRTVAGKAWKP